MSNKTYIVDIDETICSTPKLGGKSQYKLAKPKLSRISKINSLYDAGHTIIYWTARGSSSGIDYLDLTKSQLQKWGVKSHDIRVGKPSYDIWIDDKAINDKDFFQKEDWFDV
jgi:dTDP-glucose 4,6-dehydratase